MAQQTSTNMTMIARVVSKKNTQAMIKALRAAGLTVSKISSGYECFGGSTGELLLFRAMIGNNGYLIRMRADLFV
jgi:hypothetical protein